ncbi:AAA family ATPase [Kitasatospora cheerisanensis]|uniref:AAA family ATPase n=1 Tax=Kitasatospora cheerisanensis TaxID=81942 RepID=UPI00055D85E1|nr:AAA family ATPase [Kitasatospora cheerisanensis]
MKFEVLSQRRFPSESGPRRLFLVPDGWNDYGFVATYDLWFRDGQGNLNALGQVKIGRRGLTTSERPIRPGSFQEIDRECFSLGQDDSYYEEIQSLGDTVRVSILKGLRDIAFDPEIFEIAINERVTLDSLLRSVARPTVENQFRRIAGGGSRLTDYRFRYTPPLLEDSTEGHPSKSLEFEVKVGATPPTNLHVLIGRNGAGKTTILQNIAFSLIHAPGPTAWGSTEMVNSSASTFTNCITVSFSAFDTFDLPLDAESDDDFIGRSFIGLHSLDGQAAERSRHLGTQLSEDFGRCIVRIVESGRVARWLRAVQLLRSDPHFERIQASSLLEPWIDQGGEYADNEELESLREESVALFGDLSAGHKIVLLTLSRLIETVAEGSIVLLDEPETHLHPPLLAAFIRALSDLLINRNGVAVIATHSPVVLQEVPKLCVWKITGWDDFRAPERPTIETFGENVGILTHEVFGLEVMESGFHHELRKAVARLGSYRAVVDHFDGQLGSEAKGLVRVLLATTSREGRP